MKAYLYVDRKVFELPYVTEARLAQDTGTFVKLMIREREVGLLNAGPGSFVYWGEDAPIRSDFQFPPGGWERPATGSGG